MQGYDNIVAILAGGASRRMGNQDKAEYRLKGRRLIDHVIDRIKEDDHQIVISGRHDYATGLAVIPDENMRFGGPALGVWSLAKWVLRHTPEKKGFVTIPVDAPFFPEDLITRLSKSKATSIVKTPHGYQATFAYWDVKAVLGLPEKSLNTRSLSLNKLADLCHAKHVIYEKDALFANINTYEDAKEAVKSKLK